MPESKRGRIRKWIGLQSSEPHPYVMALVTAALAGLFSVIGSYYTTKFQMNQAVVQKQLECRVSAYTAFLEKIDRSRAPAISQILTIGSMAEHVATDSEIQAFEDRVFSLLTKHDAHDLYWQLNADLNILRLHGTKSVARTCDDILKVLLLRDHEIDWTQHSPEVAAFYKQWKVNQEQGTAYGWEERVSPEERLMIVMMAKLTEVLIAQLREEIHGRSA
ncbi:MAG TPA: hypothetical protein VNZ68_02695 [Rhodocyclaceae bacterium]|nr:hypothetical protein [Rhodocyclaceae bacterium]